MERLDELDGRAECVGLGAGGLVVGLAVVSFGLMATTLSRKSSSGTSSERFPIAFSMLPGRLAMETVRDASAFMVERPPGLILSVILISARPDCSSICFRRCAGDSVRMTSRVGRTCPSTRWPPRVEPSERPTTTWAWTTGTPSLRATSPISESTSTCSFTGIFRYSLLPSRNSQESRHGTRRWP